MEDPLRIELIHVASRVVGPQEGIDPQGAIELGVVGRQGHVFGESCRLRTEA